MKIKLFTFIAIVLYTSNLNAQLQSISQINDKVLVVHFDEGEVLPALNGQAFSNDILNINPVDISAITNTTNYSITSNSDTNYSNAQFPISVNRKSKPTAFKNDCDNFGFLPFYGIDGCSNPNDDHADEHFIYLTLPSNLQTGASYTINTQNITTGQDIWTFTFDPKLSKTSAIHVNNVAYSTEATAKFAYSFAWLGDGGSLDLSSYAGNNFGIMDTQTGNEVYTGTLQFRKDELTLETFQVNPLETPNQNFLGAEVYECDFSSFNVPGVYYIYIDGIGASNNFKIACNATRLPFELVMKGLFNQRSGIVLDNPNTEAFRAAPHNPQLTPGFGNRLKFTNTTLCDVSAYDSDAGDLPLWQSGIEGTLTDTWGWYQDAGDWDGYISHCQVPAKLMLTYEHFPNNFSDGQLNIPTSGNGIPDILDEARWLIRFYKRLKDETESKGWTTGGVGGSRIFGDLFGDDFGPNDIVRGSWQDNDRDWIVSGEDYYMTFYYAALAANFSYHLAENNLTDPENIDWQQEAIDAYDWADQLYVQGDSCHEISADQLKNYACASLYRLTGDSDYNDDFVTTWTAFNLGPFDLIQNEQAFGAFIYQNTNEPKDPTTDASTLAYIEATGDFQLLTNIDLRSCRWGGNHFFPMLSGHATTPYVYEGIMAMALIKNSNPTKADQYLENLYTTADYFLGGNALNKTWITGLNDYSPKQSLHLDSWATGNGKIKAGIVPYGPWRQEVLQPWVTMGSYHHMWPDQFVYPSMDLWPGHERWFEQRISPLATEFTIHQNTINAAALYGALSGEYDCTPTTGIANIKTFIDCLEVLPNPTTQFFTIQGVLPSYNITIVDANGASVMNVPNQGNEIIVDTNLLGAGMYFIKVTNSTNSNVCVQKIIKMN